MKLTSWNANCKFRSKFNEVDVFGWDVLVIQECENPETSVDTAYTDWAERFHWVGRLSHKGLGLFLRPGLEAEEIVSNDRSNKYFINVKLSNGIQLLAVWTQADTQRSRGYIYMLWDYLKSNEDVLDWDNLVVVGDWNSNAQWDTKRKIGNHTDVCNLLHSRGLKRCYHHAANTSHGSELDHTFFMHRNPEKPYHIDYMFAPKRMMSADQEMVIGDKEHWLALSDHLPISYRLNAQVSGD